MTADLRTADRILGLFVRIFFALILLRIAPRSIHAWISQGFRLPPYPRWLHAVNLGFLLLFLVFAWLGSDVEPENTRTTVVAALLIPTLIYVLYYAYYVLLGGPLEKR
ncbi:MAG: hypothetical protein HY077_08950 [Elusimicrobia bacterium]|nr:hypothetical protein [Elusimicrobiota bacterium]